MDPLNIEFARLLNESGWSQSEAARRLELSAPTVSQYISGDTRPSLTIIKLFKLMLGDLTPVLGSRDTTSNSTTGLRPLEDYESEMIEALRTVKASDRPRLVKMFKELASLISKSQPSKKPK